MDTVEIPAPTEIRALTLRLPAELHDQARDLAGRHERSLAAELRVAVREHLARETSERAER